jgi:hypothetical protein
MARLARTDEIGELDARRGPGLQLPQVEDPQVGDLDAPEPAALRRRIDAAARRGAPLSPRRCRVEGRVERPRIAGAVVSSRGGGGPGGRQAGDADAGLPVDSPGEPAERIPRLAQA